MVLVAKFSRADCGDGSGGSGSGTHGNDGGSLVDASESLALQGLVAVAELVVVAAEVKATVRTVAAVPDQTVSETAVACEPMPDGAGAEATVAQQ